MRRRWLPALLLALPAAGCSSAALTLPWATNRPERTELPELAAEPGTDLPAPRAVRAVSGELRAIPLRWEPVLAREVGGYVVERAEEREGPWIRVAVLAGRAATSHLDRGPGGANSDETALGDGATRFYRVRAFTILGALSMRASEPVVGSTAPPPAPPPALRAYSHQPRQVPITWDPPLERHVAGYVVERSPTSRGPFEVVARIQGRNQTTHLDRGLGDLRVFYYRVYTVNPAGGEGPPSEPVRAVTKPEPLPPVGLHVAGRGLGANEVTWEPNVEPDLSGYRLLRRRAGGDFELVAELPGAQTAAVDPAVAAGEEVLYTAIAVDADGLESDAAAPIAVTSEAYGLAAIARPDGVHIEWKPRDDEGFRGARIYLDSRLGGRSELGFAERPPFVHREAHPGGTYRYTVVLERADGSTAPPSAPVQIAVPGR